MALDIGDINASTGAAKRIYDLFIANSTACGFGAAPSAGAQIMLRAQAYCIAKGLIDEITANAVVSVDIPDDMGGLQTSTNPGDPTDPPADKQTLQGTIG